MATRNRWTRPGTVPVLIGVTWAFAVALFFLTSPVTLDGNTIVQEGGLPAFIAITAPLGLTGVPLSLRDERLRRRWVLTSAILLTVFGLLVPIPIGFYFISAIALWASYSVLRQEDRRPPHQPAG